MAYIELIGKIKQKNNGTFKLMDAVDVEMSDGTSVEERIVELEKNQGTGGGSGDVTVIEYDDTKIKKDIADLQSENANTRETIEELQTSKADSSAITKLDNSKADREELAALDEAKADKDVVNELKTSKADRTDIEKLENDKADKTDIQELDEAKADRTEIPDISNLATTEYVDKKVASSGGSGGASFETSDTIPTENADLGKIVFNSSPIAGGYIGWVYTPVGWLGFGKIQASNRFTLSDGTNFVLSDGTLFVLSENNNYSENAVLSSENEPIMLVDGSYFEI